MKAERLGQGKAAIAHERMGSNMRPLASEINRYKEVRRLNLPIAVGLSLATVAGYAQQNPPSYGRAVTKLYTEYCASCHGTDLAGGSGSSLVDGVWRYGGDDASVAASIRK